MALRFESLEARELLTVTAIEPTLDSYLRASPRGLVQDDDVAWFSIFNSERETLLWRTDGTSDGTNIVEDDSQFIADARGNSRLQVGTDVADLINEDDSISVDSITPFGDGFAFVEGFSDRIWVSDGTVDGTGPVTSRFVPRQPGNVPTPQIQPHGGDIYVAYFWDPTTRERDITLQKWSPDSEEEALKVVHEFAEDERIKDVDVRQFGDQIWVRAWGDSSGQLWTLDAGTDELTLVYDWNDRYPSWNDVSQLEDGRIVFTVGTEPTADSGYEFTHRELWITDGSPEGTTSLVTLDEGMIVDVLGVDTSVYYVMLAEDGNYDLMQIADGGSPEKIYDFSQIVGQFDDALHQVGSTIVFSDGSDRVGEEMALYRFGTADANASVELVRNFDAGFASSLVTWSGGTLFTADDGSGLALWTSDGSAAGTTRLQTIDLFSWPRRPFIPTDNYLLMPELHISNSGFFTQRLWSRDPAGNVELLAEVPATTELLFDDEVSTEDPNVSTIVTDGTRDGTGFVKFGEPEPLPMISGREPNIVFPTDPTTVGDNTFFVKWTEEHGTELWARSEADGERLVRDINPGGFNSHPRDFAVVDDILYFSASDRTTLFQFGDIEVQGEENWELWRSDGTTAGTFKLAELNPSPEAFPFSTSNSNASNFRSVENGFVFTAIFDGQRQGVSSLFAGQGWFISDGTTEGTFRLDVLDDGAIPVDLQSDEPGYFAGPRGLIYTDGTAEGTSVVGPVPISGDFESVSTLFVAGEFTFFRTVHSDGVTVWHTDGAAKNTTVVETIADVSDIDVLAPTDEGEPEDRFFLLAEGDDTASVWFVDGLDIVETLAFEGDIEVSRSRPADAQTGSLENPHRRIDTGEQFFSTRNDLFVTVSWPDEEDRSEMWVTDGTEEGSFQIEQIALTPNLWFVDGDRVWFVSEDEELGEELWVTDGTQAGTFVYDLNPGNASSTPRSMIRWREELYFTASQQNPDSGQSNSRLWKVGTSELAADFNNDDVVNFQDFLTLSGNFGKAQATPAEGDTNGDGVISFPDFLELSRTFNQRKVASFGTVEPIQRDLDNIDAIFATIMESADSEG